MGDDLRAIAEQLSFEWSSLPSTDTVAIVLERAMRLRDEAWSSEVKRIAKWDRVEMRLPTEEQLNAKMAELLKAENHDHERTNASNKTVSQIADQDILDTQRTAANIRLPGKIRE